MVSIIDAHFFIAIPMKGAFNFCSCFTVQVTGNNYCSSYFISLTSSVMELKFSYEFHFVKVIVSVYRHVTWETMKCILCGQSTPVIIDVVSYQQNSVMFLLLSTPCQTSCIAYKYHESLRYVVVYFVSSLLLAAI